jgi:hypothetical protein
MTRPSPEFDIEYFSVSRQMGQLVVFATDSEDLEPPAESAVQGDDGLVRGLRNEPLDSKSSRFWRKKLAKELVHKFLTIDLQGRKPYTLTKFPPGYHLFTRYVGTHGTRADKRKDTYLRGGKHEFRSPQEAMFHFAWLMHGMQPGRCICVYCTSDKSTKGKQGPLNKIFQRAWREYREQLEQEEREAQLRNGAVPQPPLNTFNEQCFLKCD